LDGIEYEFKKIDTVLGYKEIYNYVPSWSKTKNRLIDRKTIE
jgi:uncharacterized protein involved in tellurium resistance